VALRGFRAAFADVAARLAHGEVAGEPEDLAVPRTIGRKLSRDAIERCLARSVTATAADCPPLTAKHVPGQAGNDVALGALRGDRQNPLRGGGVPGPSGHQTVIAPLWRGPAVAMSRPIM